MNTQIRALVALDQGVARQAVEAALPRDTDLHVTAVIEGIDESWRALQEASVDLLVVACTGYSDRALFLIEGAVKQRPSRAVVVLIDGPSNGFLRRLFDAGADDVVMLPQSPESMRFTLQKAIVRRQGAGTASTKTGEMISVLGPKGGTGKTLTSTNLAVGLALAGNSVALVDLDLQFGDVGLCMGLAPDTTIYDLANSGGSLDAEKLDGFLSRHPGSGVRVLLAPTRPDHASSISVDLLREVYAELRASFDFVVVDTPPGFTPEVIASIDDSSHICMVGMLDSLSLKNTKLGLETLELMGWEPDHVRLVLNRAGSRVGITTDDVEAIIGRAPDVRVPSDREIPRAVNEGKPIILARPDSEAARAFKALAASYTTVAGEAAPGDNGSRRRLIGRRS